MNFKQITIITIQLLFVIVFQPNQILATQDSIQYSTTDSISSQKQTIDSITTNKSRKITKVPISSGNNTVVLDTLSDHHDSLQRENRRNILEHNRVKRSLVFNRTPVDTLSFSPFDISNDDIYRSDMSSPSEFLVSYPFLISVPFGLSNSLNRVLYFGNTAPITVLSSGLLLDNIKTHPLEGTDQIFLTETATIQLRPGYLSYSTPSYALTVPEALIFWENGVFDENILNVRFSRPFTRSLTAHIFSNYRYFKGKSFSHQGNDVFSFFESFQDSADVSNKGYTPLTNEHATGAGLHWKDRNHSANMLLQYGEFNNEIALNKAGEIDKAVHAMYYRYPLSLTVNVSLALHGPLFTDFETQYHNEPIVRITGETQANSNNLKPSRNDAKENRLRGAFRTGIRILQNDSMGVWYKISTFKRVAFNDSEINVIQHKPALFYIKHFQINNYSGIVSLDAGNSISSFKDSTSINLQWNASTVISSKNKIFRLYANQDILPFINNFDTIAQNTFLIDGYFRAGCEVHLNYNLFDLLLGYQFLSGIDSQSVINAWPSGTPPYQQPRSSFVVAPLLTIGNYFSLKSHTMISEIKPYVKTYGSLNYTRHRLNTSVYVDITLYSGYWSERERVVFAGRDDWNKPIIHSGLEIATHIQSFRLFYKVDNIINRQFAYVPGYYSPGITFRWGFNWFIQR